MSEKIVAGECSSCESSFEVAYEEEMVSSDLPECCPFCGEAIEDVVEEEMYDEDTDPDEEEWD